MIRILRGDCRDVLKTLPDASVHCCVTSPPYFGLRDYGVAEQIGLEATPAEYVAELVAVFAEVRRVLRDDGTLWLNLGDSYAGGKTGRSDTGPDDIARRAAAYGTGAGEATGPATGEQRKPPQGFKPKDLIGIPWRVAFALRADGWYLRQDIIWSKPNPMPESVKDRCTKAHEYVFLLSKSARYWFDSDAMQEPSEGRENFGNVRAKGDCEQRNDNTRSDMTLKDMRNKRSVWTIATQPFSEAHFATMAPELAETCIKAGCPVGGTVLDPFGGAGTTGLVADRLQRDALLIELNPEYAGIAERRIVGDAPLFADVA